MAAHLLLEGIELGLAAPGSSIVEIGSVREPSELPSSLYFARLAERWGLRFLTVDFSERSWRLAQQYVGAQAVFEDGRRFLEAFAETISVLYLDSFDYPYTPAHTRALQERCGDVYEEKGEALTRERSAQVHEEQFLAALPKLGTPSWILIDNTHRQLGWGARWWHPFFGKGERVIPEALRHGFQIEKEGLGGVLLGRSGQRVGRPLQWVQLYAGGGRTRFLYRALGAREPLVVRMDGAEAESTAAHSDGSA